MRHWRPCRRPTPAGLADAAGCSTDLVDAIERGTLAPAAETAERLANSMHLETRMGPAALNGLPAQVGDQFDNDLVRVREALAAETEFRARFGVGPPAPLPETVAPWDGTDPAPSRMCSAWPTRTDFGDTAASALRYARRVVAPHSASPPNAPATRQPLRPSPRQGERRPPPSTPLSRHGPGSPKPRIAPASGITTRAVRCQPLGGGGRSKRRSRPSANARCAG